MRYSWINPDSLNFKNKFDYILYLRHLKAYQLVEKFCKNKKILEIGCGAAYGTINLSNVAKEIKGVDINLESIRQACEKHDKKNINYLVADPIIGLPFDNDSFDIVISFQVIEHVSPSKINNFLYEIKRVLKKEGETIISTPNKKLRLLPFQKPWNEFHKKEYDVKSLKKVCSKIFNEVEIFGLRAINKIEKIEKKRVKLRQSPIQVYTPTFIYNYLKKIKNKLFPSRKIQNKYKSAFSKEEYYLSDFYITKKGLNNSIDLFSRCKK